MIRNNKFIHISNVTHLVYQKNLVFISRFHLIHAVISNYKTSIIYDYFAIRSMGDRNSALYDIFVISVIKQKHSGPNLGNIHRILK